MSTDNPDQPSLAYQAMAARWAQIDALLSGSAALRNETYLPPYLMETPASYDARKIRTFLLPTLADAIRDITGQVFARPISVDPGMPAQIKGWLDDIDLQGNSINRFAATFFQKAVAHGPGYILVDYERVPANATAAGERQIGARPYWVHVPATALIAGYTERVGGETIFTHVRIRESVTRRDGFKEKVVPRVRVLEPGIYQLWENDGGWKVIEEGAMSVGGKPWDRVPIAPLFTTPQTGDCVCDPPLWDLAEKNLEHFQSSSDYKNNLTFASFPMLACSGYDPAVVLDEDGNPKPLPLGPRTVLTTQDPQGKWYYIEPDGAALEAGRKHLEDLKGEMRELARKPMTQRMSEMTDVSRMLEAFRAKASTAFMAAALEDCINLAAYYMARWAGLDRDLPKLQVNPDFGLDFGDKTKIESVLKMRATRDLSRLTMFERMQHFGVLDGDFDPEEEEARLETESDLLPSANPDDAGAGQEVDPTSTGAEGGAAVGAA